MIGLSFCKTKRPHDSNQQHLWLPQVIGTIILPSSFLDNVCLLYVAMYLHCRSPGSYPHFFLCHPYRDSLDCVLKIRKSELQAAI